MRFHNLDFQQAKVLVFGDIMLDGYWYGNTGRISPEAPVPVVHVKNKEERPGGAGNVALNVAALGGIVNLFGVCGKDEAGEKLISLLNKSSVKTNIQQSKDVTTINKLRVISLNQQLIRLDFEEPLIENISLATEVINALPQYNALILSDYGKGTLKQMSEIIAKAKEKNVPVFIDPKLTNYEYYRGATVITPNRKEFESVVGPCEAYEEFATKARALMKAHDINAILITLGKDGMLLVEKEGEPFHLSTIAREVFDVTGAGDTVIATLATAVAAGYGLRDAMELSNTAAGIVVGKLGAATASLPELRHALHAKMGSQGCILDEEHLKVAVKEAKEAKQKIVMTNGCFDILHPGHIAYLEEAKALGDKLIVAVNSDESVKRQNKGDNRPINPLHHRMSVLAGLEAVDWVVSFNEDTPEKLISTLLPHILVKGADWEGKTIAGAKAVEMNGGEVAFLTFIKGYSTTNIVKKILKEELV